MGAIAASTFPLFSASHNARQRSRLCRQSDPLKVLKEKSRGAISIYAQGADYHDVLKAKLKPLAVRVQKLTGGEVKIFVDTAPVMEKPLAARAGLGWQGKHTNLVSREFGSWLFIGSIFTSVEIEADAAEENHCGACRRCLDICPTGAFTAPYQMPSVEHIVVRRPWDVSFTRSAR